MALITCKPMFIDMGRAFFFDSQEAFPVMKKQYDSLLMNSFMSVKID